MFVRNLVLVAIVPVLPILALDFRNAVIVIPANASKPEKKAAAMLSEEIEKRTQLRLPVQTQAATGPAFILGRTDQVKSVAAAQLGGAPAQPDGFTVATSSSGTPVAVITGHDDRAVVFGAG